VRAYLDSSAIVKRGVAELWSVELEATLTQADGLSLYTSSLAWIEVSRVLRLRGEANDPRSVVELIDSVLSGIHEVPISMHVISLAQRIGSTRLRSLDAIHLASASLLDVDLVIGYDERLLTIAAELGFRTSSPGMD
jgi:uncharacterized protein